MKHALIHEASSASGEQDFIDKIPLHRRSSFHCYDAA